MTNSGLCRKLPELTRTSSPTYMQTVLAPGGAPPLEYWNPVMECSRGSDGGDLDPAAHWRPKINIRHAIRRCCRRQWVYDAVVDDSVEPATHWRPKINIRHAIRRCCRRQWVYDAVVDDSVEPAAHWRPKINIRHAIRRCCRRQWVYDASILFKSFDFISISKLFYTPFHKQILRLFSFLLCFLMVRFPHFH